MRKYIRRIKNLLILVVLITIYYGISHLPIVEPYVRNPSLIRETILTFGFIAPLAVVFFQAFQTIISIIPSQLTTIAAGFLFGPFWGVVYSLIGAVIGSAFVFFISRKYGAALASRLFEKREIIHFQHLFKQKKLWALFLARIAPLFPNDVVSFGAGLTTLRFWSFTLVSTLGFMVQMALLSYFGAELSMGTVNSNLIVISTLVSILLLIVFFKHRIKTIIITDFHKIEKAIRRDLRKVYV